MRVAIALLLFSCSAMAREIPSPSRLLKSNPLSEKQIRSACVPIEMGESKLDCQSCKVTGVEELGKFGDAEFAIARYEYFWAPKSGSKNCGYGTVLLKRESARSDLRPVWGGLSEEPPTGVGKPKIIQNQFGSLIQIPVRLQGTGHFQVDGILQWKDGTLHELDTKSFEAELKKRIPVGLAINKGVYPDYAKMTVESDLWKKDDPNCCPTGGKIRATLRLRGDSVILVSSDSK